MPHKPLTFRNEARSKNLRGAGQIADALENAVSVAGVLLLTDATMTDLPEPKHAQAATDAGLE